MSTDTSNFAESDKFWTTPFQLNPKDKQLLTQKPISTTVVNTIIKTTDPVTASKTCNLKQAPPTKTDTTVKTEPTKPKILVTEVSGQKTGSNKPSDKDTTDSDMTDSILSPGQFFGRANEDPEAWMTLLIYWLDYKHFDKSNPLSAIGLLMRGAAQDWFASIREECKSVTDFLEHFKRRYITPDANLWKDHIKVFDVVQNPGQSVEEYFTELLRQSRKAEISPKMLMSQALKGLKPSIRQMVQQHECDSLDALRKWALLAEQNDIAPSGPDPLLLQVLKEIRVLQKSDQDKKTNETTGHAQANALANQHFACDTTPIAVQYQQQPITPQQQSVVYQQPAPQIIYQQPIQPTVQQTQYQQPVHTVYQATVQPTVQPSQPQPVVYQPTIQLQQQPALQQPVTYQQQQPVYQPRQNNNNQSFYQPQQQRNFQQIPPSRQFNRAGPRMRVFGPNNNQIGYNNQVYNNAQQQMVAPNSFNQNSYNQQGQMQQQNNMPQQQQACRNCLLDHQGRQCPASGQQCNNCQRFGHYARACRSARLYVPPPQQP